jgi:hypothetical protein
MTNTLLTYQHILILYYSNSYDLPTQNVSRIHSTHHAGHNSHININRINQE